MRRTAGAIVGVLGILAATAIIAGVARYGFLTSDTPIDGAIWATAFGIVALMALGGPLLAILLGRLGKGWGTFAWIIALCAFAINCSNSLGAISGRGDKTMAERTKAVSSAKDNRTELKRLESERAAMPAFVSTTQDAVTAAHSAVHAAERARSAECGNGDARHRGANCRRYEDDEKSKRDVLARVLTDKAATDRAARLETAAAALKAKMEKAPAVQDVNPQGAALARIFRIEDADTASSIQQMAMVTFVELAIAFMLAAAEKLLERAPAVKPAPENSPEVETPPAIAPEKSPNVIAFLPAPLKSASVPDILVDLLKPAKGQRVELEDIFRSYAAKCRTLGARVVEPEQFIDPAQRFCLECGIRTQVIDDHIYLMDVQLAGAKSKANRLGQMTRTKA